MWEGGVEVLDIKGTCDEKAIYVIKKYNGNKKE